MAAPAPCSYRLSASLSTTLQAPSWSCRCCNVKHAGTERGFRVKSQRGLERFCTGLCYISHMFVRPGGRQTVEVNRERLERMYPGAGLLINHLLEKETQKKKALDVSSEDLTQQELQSDHGGWW